MRRRIALVALAGSTMVAVAFVIPLAFLVRSTAEDRAVDAARADAAAVVPTLVAGTDRSLVEAAVGATAAGAEDRLSVVFGDGGVVGADPGSSPALAAALGSGASAIADTDGGVEVITAVARSGGELAAVRVFVPEADLHRGERNAWVALGLVAVVLVAISVAIADRLAQTIVAPTVALAGAARRLGDGELDTRVDPEGPDEIVELSTAFNDLGARISGMLDHERELVAELSHRLRTPLTKLRMRVDQVDDRTLADELRGDVDELTAVVTDLIREARDGADPDLAPGCDAAHVAEDRVAYWSVLAEDQGRPWRFDRRAGAAPVALAESELAAALDVLIENVFAHTDEGVPIAVQVVAVDAELRLGVGDGGPGFDRALAARGASAGTSTGLGLDIARRTAERMGGRLEIGRSDLGGTLVEIILPLRPATVR